MNKVALLRYWARSRYNELTRHGTGPPVRLFSFNATLRQNVEKPRNARKPRDSGINIPVVQVVDEGNNISPPEPLADILKRVKPRTHFVELVQEDPPLVKIKDRLKERAERAAAKSKRRASKMERKEIQMTWNVTDSDLQHKIMKAREQVEDNNLVDFAFAPKAKQRLPPLETMQEKMQKVIDDLQDIAVERQERTLRRGVGILYLRLDKSKYEQNE